MSEDGGTRTHDLLLSLAFRASGLANRVLHVTRMVSYSRALSRLSYVLVHIAEAMIGGC